MFKIIRHFECKYIFSVHVQVLQLDLVEQACQALPEIMHAQYRWHFMMQAILKHAKQLPQCSREAKLGDGTLHHSYMPKTICLGAKAPPHSPLFSKNINFALIKNNNQIQKLLTLNMLKMMISFAYHHSTSRSTNDWAAGQGKTDSISRLLKVKALMQE